ncbi:MAG: aminodeoxychorismate synthase component I [Elusimicrobia bacterium]|nr:aminodeoxychorismate synthase component I [Elusimicrobiota bacterium]MBP9699554.1 aminodeoxychorismate synthase component I [Elusimicrobiota bacterium]
MNPPTAVFESFDPDRSGWSAWFGRPRVVRQAKTLSQVRPLLDFLEGQVRHGRWGVLLLSYEAAPGLNPALTTRRAGDLPLAWAAVFDRPHTVRPPIEGPFHHSPWRPASTEKKYATAVQKIQHYIERGDTYQVNFTFPLRAQWSGDPWAWYRQLRDSQGAPYSAYVDLGRWKILSLSPELFFEKRGNRLVARPMKGSAPRGRWEEEDRAFARGLRLSLKERAENVMIVDLLRNDLGKIAHPGSVRTTRLFKTEPYPTLWQMTSEIEARLCPNVGLNEMMEALFPSGSVTGAPKRRTMEIIQSLETGPRGVYTGTLGLLRPNGHWTFNVAIRTLTLDEKTGEARCPVGSGVTIASDASAEYRECLLKGDFLKAPSYELFESIRLENRAWYLLAGHLDRLRRSAQRLGFPWNPKAIRAHLKTQAHKRPNGRWKVRLLLSRDGTIRCESTGLEGDIPRWRVVVAQQPVDESDLFLYHKTTCRDVYDSFRRAHPDDDDVILWNRRGELTESTLANLVIEIRGRRYTPPVRCGLLGGVMRRHLIRQGKIIERVLTRHDLRRADRVFLINSVRGWIPVDLPSRKTKKRR